MTVDKWSFHSYGGSCNDYRAALYCFKVSSVSTTSPTFVYVDNDSDGYGAGELVFPCPAGKTCVSNNQDCYDLNANAKPSQINYFSTTRGTSVQGNDQAGNSWNSYDYDCNGTAQTSRHGYFDGTGKVYVYLPSNNCDNPYQFQGYASTETEGLRCGSTLYPEPSGECRGNSKSGDNQCQACKLWISAQGTPFTQTCR